MRKEKRKTLRSLSLGQNEEYSLPVIIRGAAIVTASIQKFTTKT